MFIILAIITVTLGLGIGLGLRYAMIVPEYPEVPCWKEVHASKYHATQG